jgi:hypothetical protein
MYISTADHLRTRSATPPPQTHIPYDNMTHNTLDVPVLLSEIDVPQSGWVFVVVSVGFEDPSGLSLRSDDSLLVFEVYEENEGRTYSQYLKLLHRDM